METTRTEPQYSLFWLVTGYVIIITLLVLLGAALYYFTGSSINRKRKPSAVCSH